MKFKGKFLGVGPKRAWTFMKIPFSVEKEFGARGQVRVRGTLNGFPYRGTLMPLGGGKHHMMINKQMQAGARAGSVLTRVVGPRLPRQLVAGECTDGGPQPPGSQFCFTKLALCVRNGSIPTS